MTEVKLQAQTPLLSLLQRSLLGASLTSKKVKQDMVSSENHIVSQQVNQLGCHPISLVRETQSTHMGKLTEAGSQGSLMRAEVLGSEFCHSHKWATEEGTACSRAGPNFLQILQNLGFGRVDSSPGVLWL